MFFFFNDTATTEIYTLSLHDALPIFGGRGGVERDRVIHGRHRGRIHEAGRRSGGGNRDRHGGRVDERPARAGDRDRIRADRKSTRLNSSHVRISYAVFCLKKKKKYYE